MLPPRSQSLALRALGRLQPRTGKRGQANGDRRDVFQFSFGLGIAIRSGGRFKSQHLLSCILCDTENVPSVPNFCPQFPSPISPSPISPISVCPQFRVPNFSPQFQSPISCPQFQRDLSEAVIYTQLKQCPTQLDSAKIAGGAH